MARGLLEDDHEWRICLEEAVAMQPGMACHQLLAVILLTDEVAEPHLLWDQFLLIFHQYLFHSNSGLTEFPILSCRLSSMMQMKWLLWWMSKGQSSILTKLLLLMLFQSLLPTIKVTFSLFILLVVMGRYFFVTLLLLRLEEEVRQHCVWHHLGLLLFCWMVKNISLMLQDSSFYP